MEAFSARVTEYADQALAWLMSPAGYVQIALIIIAICLAHPLGKVLGKQILNLGGIKFPSFLGDMKVFFEKLAQLGFPLLNLLFLSIAMEISRAVSGQVSLIQISLGLSVIFLLYGIISRFIRTRMITFLAKWVGIPVAVLHVFGVLDDVTLWLEGMAINVGNIRFSAYTLVRSLIFGSILFWLGRLSNDTGKKVIREQQDLDVRTREIVTKLFEIGLFVILFILLLQVIGIPLATLAVLGGAVGIGLGFGLQQIASNFISGIIILIDKSVSIGDYIELEDGRAGTIREMSMRSATLETFDGKDIMVPNETFITSTFTNWTHHDIKQRYSVTFSVAYSTDIPAMLDMVRELVASHPQVLSGEGVPKAEQPDVEIDEFADSGINILVEYWMDGVDDGENRVDADLKLMIWSALKQHNIEIPFPQREVRVLKEGG